MQSCLYQANHTIHPPGRTPYTPPLIPPIPLPRPPFPRNNLKQRRRVRPTAAASLRTGINRLERLPVRAERGARGVDLAQVGRSVAAGRTTVTGLIDEQRRGARQQEFDLAVVGVAEREAGDEGDGAPVDAAVAASGAAAAAVRDTVAVWMQDALSVAQGLTAHGTATVIHLGDGAQDREVGALVVQRVLPGAHHPGQLKGAVDAHVAGRRLEAAEVLLKGGAAHRRDAVRAEVDRRDVAHRAPVVGALVEVQAGAVRGFGLDSAREIVEFAVETARRVTFVLRVS